MKQKLSFLILSMFTLNIVCAQRLTYDRNAYRAADRIVKQQVEYKDPGASGKDLSWDFSMLQPINEEYSLNYFIPDSTRMDTICGLEHRTRYYYRQQHDSLWAVGFENATTFMEYRNPELKLRFPFAYGDTLYSAFEGTGQYSRLLKLQVKGYTRVEADAEGELLLPDFETVKKALRVHTLRYYTETGKDSLQMTLDTYSWYADGVRYPVFESVKTNVIRILPGNGEQQQVKDTTIFTTSFYYSPEKQISQVETEDIPEESTSVSEIETVFTEASYLPNPVISTLNINYTLSRAAQVWFSVHNSIGIPVYQTSPQSQQEGANNVSIDMSGQITGSYTLYVHVDEMVMQRVIVKK